MKKTLFATAGMSLVLALLLPGAVAEKPKLSTVSPAADLAAEAEAKVHELEQMLSGNDEYLKAKKKGIPRDAGAVAILGQALADHDEAGDVKIAGPALRDAGIAIGKATSLDDAKKGLDMAKAALAGEAGDAKAEFNWADLADMDSLMAEVNVRNGRLRRAARKLPDDVMAASRDASVLAVLALAISAKGNSKDAAAWEEYALEMQTQYTKVAAAMKDKNSDDLKAAFTAANKSCNECHSKFRDN